MEHSGLYVHLPFCVTKCPYCDFYSVTDRSQARRLVAALELEAARSPTSFGDFDTLYLGGGTPSCLGPELIAELVEALTTSRSLRPTGDGPAEWTVELNPEDVTAELLQSLRSSGFNRVSLGVQSFRDEELAFLGRRHRAAKARWAIEAARAAGFDELSLDLMYGLSPAQTPKQWCENLEQALAFEPEHLSCYQLTLAPGTSFHTQHVRGGLALPEDEVAADLFLLTSELLGYRGYEHYEISNFARGRSHRSRHNGKYWRHVPYLGLGPSAHSFDGEQRWWNLSDVGGYLERVGGGGSPVAERELLGPEEFRLEALFLGFRTSDGVSLELIRSFENGEEVVGQLEAEGLVRVVGGRLIPTVHGFLVADGLPLRFRG